MLQTFLFPFVDIQLTAIEIANYKHLYAPILRTPLHKDALLKEDLQVNMFPLMHATSVLVKTIEEKHLIYPELSLDQKH